MGGMSLSEAQPFDGYSCPWCPTTVLVATSQEAARDVMERHLDDHFAVAVPVTGAEAAPKLRPVVQSVQGAA